MRDPTTPLPGTPLSDAAVHRGEALTQQWPTSLRYAWDAGVAIGRFLRELREGHIIGRRCERCQRVLVPPRMFCEHCYGPTDEWIELPDTGKVETYSVSYLDSDARRIKEPILIGVISIDGASPLHGFMHYFGEMKPEELHIGMKVKAVWKPEKDREGSITDVKYFKPLKKGGRKK